MCYSFSLPLPASGRNLLRAIYEYTAQYDEELTFPEGAIIELIRTDDNNVDDGWWEGRYNGKVGVFPSVVVELLSDGAVSQFSLSQFCIFVHHNNYCTCMCRNASVLHCVTTNVALPTCYLLIYYCSIYRKLLPIQMMSQQYMSLHPLVSLLPLFPRRTLE